PNDEIVAAQALRERPADVEVERGSRLKRELVTEARESHKAAQLVIAVGAPSENLERQIELCSADLSERHQPAPQASQRSRAIAASSVPPAWSGPAPTWCRHCRAARRRSWP